MVFLFILWMQTSNPLVNVWRRLIFLFTQKCQWTYVWPHLHNLSQRLPLCLCTNVSLNVLHVSLSQSLTGCAPEGSTGALAMANHKAEKEKKSTQGKKKQWKCALNTWGKTKVSRLVWWFLCCCCCFFASYQTFPWSWETTFSVKNWEFGGPLRTQ